MKVAIVHYWFVSMRGGESVVENILDIFPDADVFCHVFDADKISEKIRNNIKATTFISKLPFAKRMYQSYLPFMPLALEQLDLTSYDLVISSESGPAKGIIVGPDATHICYCHSPMRYIWDMYHDYYKGASFFKKMMMPIMSHYLRMWDVSSSQRVGAFIANSNYVARRISNFYNRSSLVINPPVSFDDFDLSDEDCDYYLMVGQLVNYKKADLAVDAFVASGKKLVIIGEGELFEACKLKATANITMLGRQSFGVLQEHFAKCKALVFPGIEDFGIVPLEVMASGRPVIAFGKGGALETVIDGTTGILFNDQTVESLNQAVERFEACSDTFDKEVIRKHAQKFSDARFKDEFLAAVNNILALES